MSGPADPRPPGGRADGPRGGRRRTGERLVALLVVGVAALNYPLLSVLRGRGSLVGVPVLFVYLFGLWALLALGTALALRGAPPEDDAPEGESGPREP